MKMRLLQSILTVCCFCACTQGKLMTYEQYHQVMVGEEISDIQFQSGRPYEVRKLSSSRQEYVYIERIPLGEHREIFRKYILTVQDGKVVEKRIVEESSSPIQYYSQ